MNSLEEIALKVAEETDAYCEHEMEQCVSRGDVFGDYREFRDKEFARRLVAALGAQEPVAWAYTINNSHSVFSAERPPEDAYDEGTGNGLVGSR